MNVKRQPVGQAHQAIHLVRCVNSPSNTKGLHITTVLTLAKMVTGAQQEHIRTANTKQDSGDFVKAIA